MLVILLDSCSWSQGFVVPAAAWSGCFLLLWCLSRAIPDGRGAMQWSPEATARIPPLNPGDGQQWPTSTWTKDQLDSWKLYTPWYCLILLAHIDAVFSSYIHIALHIPLVCQCGFEWLIICHSCSIETRTRNCMNCLVAWGPSDKRIANSQSRE